MYGITFSSKKQKYIIYLYSHITQFFSDTFNFQPSITVLKHSTLKNVCNKTNLQDWADWVWWAALCQNVQGYFLAPVRPCIHISSELIPEES